MVRREECLPDLDLDYSVPRPVLTMRVAALLAEAGLIDKLDVRAPGKYGGARIPILCKVGHTRCAPYVEAGPWSEDAVLAFVKWSAGLRFSDHVDVRVRIYSPQPPSQLLEDLNRGDALARFQLESFLLCRPLDFAGNAETLVTLVKAYFGVHLRLEPPALQELDDLIADKFGSETPLRAMSTTAYMVGCLVGEIMRLALNGKWAPTDASGFADGYALQVGEVTTNPLGKAEKRFLYGAEHSFVSFYHTTQELMKARG